MRDANAQAQRKEEAHLEIAYSCSGAGSTTHPSSPEYALEDPPEGDAELTNAMARPQKMLLLMMISSFGFPLLFSSLLPKAIRLCSCE